MKRNLNLHLVILILSLIVTVIFEFTDSESQTSEPEVEGIQSNMVAVESITDGDTFAVNLDGVVKKVRIIGIDTPETKAPRQPVECFGQQATEKLATLIGDRYVALATDPTQANQDRYGRLLRYVYLEDGTDVGLVMIAGGFATEYTYQTPHQKQAEYLAAQAEAKTNNAGFWNPETCINE
jgi:micrococcal nuclease